MADTNDEIKAALEEARRAREEADRLRREARQEAERIKDDARRARDDARRLRDQARNERKSSHGFGSGFGPPPPPHGIHSHGSGGRREENDDAGSIRSEQAIEFEGVRRVQIDQTAGKLTVRPCKEGETPGIVSSGNKASPEILLTRDGDKLQIEVKLSKGWLFRRKQGATTLVRLGNQSLEQLRIDNGYGDMELQGTIADDIRVNIGAGSFQSILTRGSIDVNVGAGKLAVLSHSGLARCDSGTGDVLLDVAELADGEYKVDVGLGRAEVRLPAGGQVFIKASSGIGKSRIEYPSAPESAPARLRLNSGIGECVVKSRDAGASEAAAKAAQSAAPVSPVGQPRPQRGSRAARTANRREGEEMRVLQMLEQGKITPQDAADLIAALQGSSAPQFDEDNAPGLFS
ncbi:MAG: hypothetical protein ABI577_08130 [bacterium]